jgi:transposase InsO family protein
LVQLVADTSIPALYVTRVLHQLRCEHGLPKVIRTDNGQEFARRTMHDWIARNGVELRFIQPWQVRAKRLHRKLHSRLHDECLSQHGFASLRHMRSELNNCRDDYNHYQPYSTLWYVPAVKFAVRVASEQAALRN